MARNRTTFKRGHKPMGGRPKGSLNRATIEVREFARRLIEDPQYQSGLRRRMIKGTAPQMEMLLFKYVYGQPGERPEANADVRAAGSIGPEPSGDPVRGDRYQRNLKIGGTELTPEGRERIRRLMESFINNMNRQGAKAKAAGELSPDATTPPGAAA